MIVVWTAERAQSYIAHARSSGRCRPRRARTPRSAGAVVWSVIEAPGPAARRGAGRVGVGRFASRRLAGAGGALHTSDDVAGGGAREAALGSRLSALGSRLSALGSRLPNRWKPRVRDVAGHQPSAEGRGPRAAVGRRARRRQ